MPDVHLDTLQLAYTQMAMDRIDLGFEPFFITLMFNPLPGSDDAMKRNMERETERLYAHLLTRAFRDPAKRPLMELPLWIACPDYPVPKLEKKQLRDVIVNDGRHYHVACLHPRDTRLPEPFNLYLARNADRFAGRDHAIARIHIMKLYKTPEVAFSYGLKSLGRGRANGDDIMVLPRTHGEVTRPVTDRSNSCPSLG